jgi:hypothetical protein
VINIFHPASTSLITAASPFSTRDIAATIGIITSAFVLVRCEVADTPLSALTASIYACV